MACRRGGGRYGGQGRFKAIYQREDQFGHGSQKRYSASSKERENKDDLDTSEGSGGSASSQGRQTKYSAIKKEVEDPEYDISKGSARGHGRQTTKTTIKKERGQNDYGGGSAVGYGSEKKEEEYNDSYGGESARGYGSETKYSTIKKEQEQNDDYDSNQWYGAKSARVHRKYSASRKEWEPGNDADEGGRGGSARGGRGGRRGGRGRSRGQSREKSASGDNYPRRRGKHPPGLKGRDIGMWYARRAKGKAEKRDREERPEVKMVQHQEQNIRRLLHDIKSSRECPPQPTRSGAQLPPQSEDMEWAEEDKEFFEELEEESFDAGNPVPAISEMMLFNAEEDYMVKDEGEVVLLKDTREDVSSLDMVLLEDFKDKQDSPTYKKMLAFRQKLPSYKDRKKIVNLIDCKQVVVLSGETGCGKTTQVPQYILDDFIERGKGSQCRIICTQPRRISAITVAERVAAERAESCGISAGYMIRLENKLPRSSGSILYCTTGILLKVLEQDPVFNKATHIILDEIHERDLLSDFLIIILRDILKKRRDLKLVLMSATLNAEAFSRYFDNCPTLNIPGFTFPVQEFLLEDVIELLNYTVPEKMLKPRPRNKKQYQEAQEEEEALHVWLRNLKGGVNPGGKRYSGNTLDALQCMNMKKIDLELIRQLIKYIVTARGEGAILVFLPGWTDISELHKLLSADTFFSPSKYRMIPLHSMMPTLNQREVFERPPAGVRKIIIATNIAETSITIDDIVYVIDGGRIKVKGFTPENNLATLDSEMVSRANARQRRGRAGRVQPGECYHLYTSLQESYMLDYLPPEILRTRLEELCLQIKYLKLGEILPFVKKAMQPPSLAALQAAIVNLQNLNALDSQENLLPLGKHLARMPLDPHTGKMILFGAMFGCLDPILTIAAALNFKDPFYVPLGKESLCDKAKMKLSEGTCSDHLLLVKAYDSWERARKRGTNRQLCYDYFMSESTLMMLKKMRDQLASVLNELGFVKYKSASQVNANKNSDNTALIKAIVCAGLYPNVAKIKSLPNKYRSMKFRTKDDGKCELHPKSVAKAVQNPPTQWVVFYQKMKTTAVYLHDCSLVSPYSLLFFGGDIKVIQEDNMNQVCVDDWIKFKASPETVQLVKELRHELDNVLDSKITNSKDWEPRSQEAAIIQAIIDLVTTEDTSSNFDYNR